MRGEESTEPEGGSTPAQALLGICQAWAAMSTAERADVRLLAQPVRASARLVEEARRWGTSEETEALDDMLAKGRVVLMSGTRPDPRALMRPHGTGKRGKPGKRK